MNTITVDRSTHLVVVTLNRPSAANAISGEMLDELAQLGVDLLNDLDLRAVIVTGRGDRVFCAGADLKERRSMSDDDVRARLVEYQTDLAWLSSPEIPTVAALNGAALGGGLELALMCDLRVAYDDVFLGLPETRLGIIPAAGGTQRLTRLVGEARAKEIILLGEKLEAVKALEMGLLHRVFARPRDLIHETIDFIEPILEGAPIAQSAALEAIGQALDLSLPEGMALERRCYERCLASEDRKEALAAFQQKRKPEFRGR
jgi:enoyl-CoA hydratase/carnithine racemase